MATTITAPYGSQESEDGKVDWLVIASVVVSVGAFLAYLAMSGGPKPTPQRGRKIQGNDAWKPPAAKKVDDEVIDRFVNALKAQSRPSA